MQNEFFLCYSIEEKRHAYYYYVVHVLIAMIRTFKDKRTERVWKELLVGKFSITLQKQALRKLRFINTASSLQDLREAPGYNLEKLVGRLHGYYSLRINRQWRIIFRWIDNHAYSVGIIDYH